MTSSFPRVSVLAPENTSSAKIMQVLYDQNGMCPICQAPFFDYEVALWGGGLTSVQHANCNDPHNDQDPAVEAHADVLQKLAEGDS